MNRRLWTMAACACIAAACGGGDSGGNPGTDAGTGIHDGGTGTGSGVAPSITTQPVDATVAEGQTATFTVAASGTAPLSYQWRKDGVNIVGATAATYATPPATAADNGADYDVVVSNAKGQAISSTATLAVTVTPPPAGCYLLGQAGTQALNGTIQFVGADQPVGSFDLVAVHPDAPGHPVTIETAGAWYSLYTKPFGAVLGAVVDSGQHTMLRQRYTIYAKGNRLMKVDHCAGVGGPVAQRWSTLTTNEICVTSYLQHVAHDYADVTRSYLFFTSPASGSSVCDVFDDRWRAVRLSMGESDAARDVAEPLATIYAASGAIAGFIVHSGDRFVRVDADLANPQDLFAAPPFPQNVGVFGSAPPGVWVYSYAGDMSLVHLASPASATPLAESIGSSPVLRQNVASDGGSLYLAVNSGNSGKIIRIDESATSKTLGTVAGAVDGLSVTPTQVVFRVGQSLQSMPKAGGNAKTIASTLGGQTFVLVSGLDRPSSLLGPLWLRAFLVAGENVYYQIVDNNSAVRYQLHIIHADGTNAQVLDGAQLVKWVAAPSLPWSVVGPAAQLYVAEPQTVHLFAASPVHLYDAATRGQTATLGTLPDGLAVSTLDTALDPVQAGQPGLVNFLDLQNKQNLLLFKSDAAGLLQVTSY